MDSESCLSNWEEAREPVGGVHSALTIDNHQRSYFTKGSRTKRRKNTRPQMGCFGTKYARYRPRENTISNVIIIIPWPCQLGEIQNGLSRGWVLTVLPPGNNHYTSYPIALTASKETVDRVSRDWVSTILPLGNDSNTYYTSCCSYYHLMVSTVMRDTVRYSQGV